MLRAAACLLIVLGAAACSGASAPSTGRYSMTATDDNNRTVAAGEPAPMDPTRTVADRDCSKAIENPGGNLRCQ
jgi:hypothetical protein